ncbi:hypothetical protein AWW67_17210 [Roseivirga seohaensis]|uniref:Methyltransferase FkbM domain-containing protein n=1 Tax=Roseivirga seohaensis TaxID=1914963 RepID=A0A150Y1S3_9BACT|nr:hypothetical protein AWW67_17210 [Roseivirga seohaensis]
MPGKNLKKYLDENYADKLSQLSLLKVDAEGYDKEILNDLADLISTYRPNIMAECYKRLTQDEREELYDSMAKHDYDIYCIDGFESSVNRILLSKDKMNIKKHFEILAIPKEK